MIRDNQPSSLSKEIVTDSDAEIESNPSFEDRDASRMNNKSSKSLSSPLTEIQKSKSIKLVTDKSKKRPRSRPTMTVSKRLKTAFPHPLTATGRRAINGALTEAGPSKTSTTGSKGSSIRLTNNTGTNAKDKFHEAERIIPSDIDPSKTTPLEIDIRRFDRAKTAAEAALALLVDDPRVSESADAEVSDVPHMPDCSRTPRIRKIRLGEWEIDTWYAAPYPEEYSILQTLHICEYCLKYMKTEYVARRHKVCNTLINIDKTSSMNKRDEIYRDGPISIFEVDGRKNKIYCQNLCLIAKMFLDHKTLYYDVEPFLFYVMTEADQSGCHLVGYFSKEKRSNSNYNLSCILTLPVHQRKGYGNLLIDFSYLLTKKENTVGTPEKPLSDLGLLSYRSYWRNVLFHALRNVTGSISISKLSQESAMTLDDVISTLEINDILVKDKELGTYVMVVDRELIEAHCQAVAARGYLTLKPEKLKWTPFILGRNPGILTFNESVYSQSSLDL
ncbi:10039_t:CDS:2 [Paraglomus brasilianum]|uniref:Histone acetyltransferase n=1 Tax=Paraglomus brasilianum TaxID=144538 RepID=A0A9N9B1K7_9GLOM|nr:10039_t:CDS:2 [Paraglomus brasilianum]